MAEVNEAKTSIWAKILAILKKIFGITSYPAEATANDQNITEWWDIYKCSPAWLVEEYVTTDGVKRKRDRLQLRMGKVACSEMAGLVLAEPPEVKTSPLVESVIKKELLWTNLRQSLEVQGALGAQVPKICIGKDDQDKTTISIDFVKASNFIPISWNNAEVTEGSFLDRRTIKGEQYTRIETHKLGKNEKGEPVYVITNEVVNESKQEKAPLELFGEGIKESETVAIDMPLFAYIRNPEANNIEPEAPTGISLFANATDTIKAIDIAFDQFYSDIELGGRRVALPGAVFRSYLEVNETSGTSKRVSYFDKSDRVFLRLEGDDTEKFKPIDLTSDIRSDQFKGAIQTLLNLFAMQIGFDAGYFSFDGVSVKTATEIISENSHTYKTMAAYRDNLGRGLLHLFAVINKLGKIYSIEGAADTETTITWDDSVIEDRNSRAKYYVDLFNSKLIDRVSALMRIHGLDETKAKEMAAKINTETATVTRDSLFGAGA